MTRGTYYSPLQEDRFIFELLVKRDGELGYFLDIECGNGVDDNNTLALERNGWTGLLIGSYQDQTDSARKNRQSPVITDNPSSFDWNSLSWKGYDYLSVNGGLALDIMPKVFAAGITFRAATIRYGANRDSLRDLFQVQGYTLILGDIGIPPQEDWWVSPSIKSIMFNLDPYLTKQTTILPAVPCVPCGKSQHS